MTKIKYSGTCPVCRLPNRNLADTEITEGPIKIEIKGTCDHCSMVIHADFDHTINILQADSYEERKKIKKKKELAEAEDKLTAMGIWNKKK